MKQKQKQKKSVMYIFLEGTAAVAALMMVGIFPLYFQNNFIDMSNAKLNIFRICSIGAILAVIVFLGMDRLQQYKDSMAQKNRKKKANAKSQEQPAAGKKEALQAWLSGISIPTWFCVVFVLGILLSVIFSVNPQESLLGKEGRKLGAIVWLLCVALCGILGKYLKPGRWLLWVFLAVNALVSLLAVLNFWKIDPLGMYSNLSSDQVGSFISTIGNVNACSGYFCMVVPAGMALYVVAKDKYVKAASAIYLLLGAIAGCCAHSESWLLGMGVAFLVLLWFCMHDNSRMRKFFDVCAIFWLGCVLMKIMLLIGGMAESPSSMYYAIIYSSLWNGIIFNGYALIVEGILLAGLWAFFFTREKSGKELPYGKIRKVVFLALAILAAAFVLLFVVVNANSAAWEGTLSVLERFRLTDDFGSGRGYIWKITVESWLKLPLWDKITGCGVNCYHMFISTYGGAGVLDMFNGAQLVDAHNEPLQILATMGVLGTVGYFGFIISTIVRSAKKTAQNPIMLMGITAILGYTAQALANNPTVFLTPYLFLMLGLTKSMENTGDAGE